MALTKVPSNLDAAVSVTQSQSDNSTNVATTAYVDTAIANLSDSAPTALNTLNEIAAALGDDANYASTTTAAIAGKLPLAGGTMTGALTINSGTANTSLTTSSSDAANWMTMTDPSGSIFFGNSGANYQLWVGAAKQFEVTSSASNFTGNVGIGTSTDSGHLNIYRAGGETQVKIRSDTNQTGNIYFTDATSGYSGSFAYDHTDDFMSFATNGTGEKMRIDAEGNVGIGVTPKDDWNTGYDAIQIGESSAFFANNAADEIFMSQNARYTSGGWKYNSSGTAALFDMQSGNTRWRRAASGSEDGTISWSDSMFIDTAGKVGIGTTSPTVDLDVSGPSSSMVLPGTSGTTPKGFLRVGYNDRNWGGNEILMGVINSGSTSYAGYLQCKAPTDYSVNRSFVINPQGGNVGIGTDTPTDTYSYGKVLDIHGSTGAVTYLRDSDATSNFGYIAYDGGTTNRCNVGGGGSAYLRFISAGNETMSISANGALHIDNTMSYTGKSWLNEAVGGSTPVGGANANVNTYQKLRLFVNGDINVNQGRGLHFGDVTDAAPLCIREGRPSYHGTDRDWLEIWGRKQLTLTSSYGRISPGDSSQAGAGRSSSFYIKKSGQMGGTWTEVITTPNGGDQTCRVFEDWTGRWVMVGRFESDARASIQGTWGSVSGLNTAVSQTTATAFSSDWGDIYPSEVRIMGCTDVDEYMDTRTIDFVYGNRPSGVHSYTPRQWKHFFAGQTSDGMLQNAGGSPRWGFTMGYSYDGKGRWYNPNQHGMGMSDTNVTNPIAAYTTPTANAFNWYVAQDAKLLATHYRTFASQDVYQTTGFGADDGIQGFYDSYPTEYTNMGGGTTGGGVHATFSSAVFILLKLNW